MIAKMFQIYDIIILQNNITKYSISSKIKNIIIIFNLKENLILNILIFNILEKKLIKKKIINIFNSISRDLFNIYSLYIK